MMDDTDNDLGVERARLQAEVMALRVERDTGVPATLLGQGATEEDMRQIAGDALAWKGEAAPSVSHKPQTGTTTPNYPVGQISREMLAQLSPEQQMMAVRQGRCIGIGVGVPQDNIGTHRNDRHV